MSQNKIQFQSRLANRLMIRVIKYIGWGLILLILIQLFATYRLQLDNRTNSINDSLDNMAPILELSLWNYNYEEVGRLAESLGNNKLISSVQIRDDFRNIIAEIGDTGGLTSLTAVSENMTSSDISNGRTAFSKQIWYRGVASEPVIIGEVIVGSNNNLVWNDITETLIILVFSLIGFVLIFLAILYSVQQSIVSKRLNILGESIAQMEQGGDADEELQVHLLTEANDELAEVYRDYCEVRNRLKERDNQLQLYHRDLEHQVDTRTGELKLANEFLKDSLEKLKMAQTELVERERLASLGGLVSGIAHEVNTPLGVSITANSFMWEEVKLVEKKLLENSLTRTAMNDFMLNCEESCSIMSSNLHRAASLIKSFKQVAVDQSSEDLRKLKISEYLQDILRSLNPQMKRSKVSIHQHVSDDYILTTYPGALAQVITNLIMNAYIHAYENGDLAGVIDISICDSEKDNEFLIKVKDQGAGMSPGIREKIYEPFFTTRRGMGGSGLGLNIVYNLVNQKLNGRMECISEEGKGTEFILHIQGTKVVEGVNSDIT